MKNWTERMRRQGRDWVLDEHAMPSPHARLAGMLRWRPEWDENVERVQGELKEARG